MPVLDSGLHIGRETVYGTPVAPTRSYEAYSDAHNRTQEYLTSTGMRSGLHGTRADRRRPINMGATGTIEVDVLNKGMGLLLQAAFGPPVITTPVGGDAARLHTYTTSSGGPTGESVTAQWARAPVDGALVPFAYHGGKVTSWTFAQEVASEEAGLLKATFEMDYEDETTDQALATPVYPAATAPYGWPDCAITIGGSSVCMRSFSVNGDNNLKTDRRLLCAGSSLKREPVRQGLPTYEGEMAVDFEDVTEYNRFKDGAVFEVVATWTGAIIEGSLPFFFRITLPAVQYSGSSPEVTNDDLPSVPLPFSVLHNGTVPLVTVAVQTTDIAA